MLQYNTIQTAMYLNYTLTSLSRLNVYFLFVQRPYQDGSVSLSKGPLETTMARGSSAPHISLTFLAPSFFF